MGPAHDGGAIREERLPTSHQNAVVVLDTCVLKNRDEPITWLDLGCGRGQVLHGIEGVFGDRLGQIRYVGVDTNGAFCAETLEFARSRGLPDPETHCCDINQLRNATGGTQVDFVTMINVMHEVPPEALATAICEAIRSLAGGGVLHISDQLALEEEEIDAVCWQPYEVKTALAPVLDQFRWTAHEQQVRLWGRYWSLQLHRDGLLLDESALIAGHDRLIENTLAAMRKLLRRKLAEHNRALEALRRSPPQTADERRALEHSLYEHWTIERWLEAGDD